MTSPRTTLGTLAAWLLNLTEGRGIVRLGIIGACLAVQTMTCAAADSKTVLARDDRQAPREPAKYLKLRNDYAERFSGGWFTNPERRGFMSLYDTDKPAFLDKSRAWLRRCPIDVKYT